MARKLAEQMIDQLLGESEFIMGDVLQSTVDAQGMKKGEQYKVVKAVDGPFGIVDYIVTDKNGKTLRIGNAHLLMKKVG